MNSKTHMIVGGMSAGLLVSYAVAKGELTLDINNIVVHTPVCIYPAVIGSILPDMDMPQTKSGRVVRKMLNMGITVSTSFIVGTIVLSFFIKSLTALLIPLIICLVLMSLFSVWLKTISHRKQTHYGIVGVLMFLPFIVFSFRATSHIINDIIGSCLLGFWIGWFSHIIADSFNKKGIPWLYPFTNKHYYIMKVKTGTKEEETFRTISIGVFCLLYSLILLLLGGV